MPRVAEDQREQYLQGKREQVLNAAVDVFVDRGFAGANVADIARAAGVGKGSLYTYFRSKEELFTAVLAESNLVPCLVDLILETLDDSIALEPALTKIATVCLEQIEGYLPLFHLAIDEANRFPIYTAHIYQDVIHRAGAILADFLTTQAESGHLRHLDDPYLTARAFIAMITTYVLTQELMGGRKLEPIKRETWVREVVQLFMKGVEA